MRRPLLSAASTRRSVVVVLSLRPRVVVLVGPGVRLQPAPGLELPRQLWPTPHREPRVVFLPPQPRARSPDGSWSAAHSLQRFAARQPAGQIQLSELIRSAPLRFE